MALPLPQVFTETFLEDLDVGVHQNGQGPPVPVFDAIGDECEYYLVFFSAGWCLPCQVFTPKLCVFYEKHHLQKKFSVVYFSRDKSETEWRHQAQSFPPGWSSLPLSYSTAKWPTIKKRYKILGIPTVLLFRRIIGEAPELISAHSRFMIENDPEAEHFPWADMDQYVQITYPT